MKRRMIILAALLGLIAVPAGAQAPAETPFPGPKIPGAFIRVATWTAPTSSFLTNFFPQGSEVTFRMFVGDNKTKRSMTNKDLQFARILIPSQPTVQMKYTNGDPNFPWSGTWKIPADYALGDRRLPGHGQDKGEGHRELRPDAARDLPADRHASDGLGGANDDST